MANLKVIALSILTIIFAAGNTIAMKQVANTVPSHIFFISLLQVGVLTVAFFIVLLFQKLFTSTITSVSHSFPKRKFAMMAIWDTLQVMLVHPPGRALAAVRPGYPQADGKGHRQTHYTSVLS